MSKGASTILDAGCGSGRDAKFFADRGYTVHAFDVSTTMVDATKALLGSSGSVHHHDFVDIAQCAEYPSVFDGIWACASLLHVPGGERAVMKAIQCLAEKLAPKGILFVSFKVGNGSRVDAWGRYFFNATAASLPSIIPSGFAATKIWETGDELGREDVRWLSAIIMRHEEEQLVV